MVPNYAPPIPRLSKPIRRRSPWNDTFSSAAGTRAPRHQGPPAHFHHNISSNDQAAMQREYEPVSPLAARDGGPQHWHVGGGRPGVRGRPRMHAAAATAARSTEQPSSTAAAAAAAVPSKSDSDRTESRAEVTTLVLDLLAAKLIVAISF